MYAAVEKLMGPKKKTETPTSKYLSWYFISSRESRESFIVYIVTGIPYSLLFQLRCSAALLLLCCHSRAVFLCQSRAEQHSRLLCWLCLSLSLCPPTDRAVSRFATKQHPSNRKIILLYDYDLVLTTMALFLRGGKNGDFVFR